MGLRVTEMKQSIKESKDKMSLKNYICDAMTGLLVMFGAMFVVLLVMFMGVLVMFGVIAGCIYMLDQFVPTCHVHPVGAPEWTTEFLNFSDKEMCSPCILCHDWPERPYVIGDPRPSLSALEGDARFMEWYKSWPLSVTKEDRANCVC